MENSQVNVKFEVRRLSLGAIPQAKKLAAWAQKTYKNELNSPIKVKTTAWGGNADAAFAGMTLTTVIIEGFMSIDGLHSDKAKYILTEFIVA